MEQFKVGLRLGGVVERLGYAHDVHAEALEEVSMAFIQQNVL